MQHNTTQTILDNTSRDKTRHGNTRQYNVI